MSSTNGYVNYTTNYVGNNTTEQRSNQRREPLWGKTLTINMRQGNFDSSYQGIVNDGHIRVVIFVNSYCCLISWGWVVQTLFKEWCGCIVKKVYKVDLENTVGDALSKQHKEHEFRTIVSQPILMHGKDPGRSIAKSGIKGNY